jgi:hypothetical protein
MKSGHSKASVFVVQNDDAPVRNYSRGRENLMGRIVHTSRIHITREKGPTRKALIEGFSEPVYYGVHGGIKSFYKVEPDKEHAATLDHIVGAVAG